MKAVHALWIVSYVANALQVALALLTLSYCQKIAQIMEEVGHSSIPYNPLKYIGNRTEYCWSRPQDSEL